MIKTKGISARILILITVIILILFLINSYVVYGINNERFAIINNINNMNDTDIIIVGNSHAQEGLNAELLNTITNKKFFNFSFSQQESAASYYFINKIIKKNKPEIIVLEAYSLIQQMQGAYDLMPFSLAKVKYYNMLKDELDFTKTFFPVFRLHNFWSKENLLNTINMNLNSTEITPVFRAEIMSEKAITRHNEFDSEKRVKNLKNNRFDNVAEIKKLCDKNDIKLVITMMPWYKTLIDKIRYDELYYQPIKELCDNNDIPFFDMNIDSNKAWDYFYFREQDYTQNTHLNVYGSHEASYELAYYLKTLDNNISVSEKYRELTKLDDFLSTIDIKDDILIIDQCPIPIDLEVYLSAKDEFKRLAMDPTRELESATKIQYISDGINYSNFSDYEKMNPKDLAVNIYVLDSETKEIKEHAVIRWDVFDTVLFPCS